MEMLQWGHDHSIMVTGAYPRGAIQIIGKLAAAYTLRGKGGKEYIVKADSLEAQAMNLIHDIQTHKRYLYLPDGTRVTFTDTSTLETVQHTGNFDVSNYHSEELFDS